MMTAVALKSNAMSVPSVTMSTAVDSVPKKVKHPSQAMSADALAGILHTMQLGKSDDDKVKTLKSN